MWYLGTVYFYLGTVGGNLLLLTRALGTQALPFSMRREGDWYVMAQQSRSGNKDFYCEEVK